MSHDDSWMTQVSEDAPIITTAVTCKGSEWHLKYHWYRFQ